MRLRRVKTGGSKKQNYTEGWVEFLSKADAKRAPELLNNSTVGDVLGKQRSFHAADILNVRYLRKFRWHHLQEKLGTLPGIRWVHGPVNQCTGQLLGAHSAHS